MPLTEKLRQMRARRAPQKEEAAAPGSATASMLWPGAAGERDERDLGRRVWVDPIRGIEILG